MKLLVNFSYLFLSPILFLQLCSCSGSNSNFQFEVLQADSMHERSQSFGSFWRNVDCHGINISPSTTLILWAPTLAWYMARLMWSTDAKKTCYNENGQCAQTIGTILTWNLNTTWKGMCDRLKRERESSFWPPTTFATKPQIWNLKR